MVEDKSYCWGTGRRKSSVARVRIRKGEGKIIINRRELEGYFSRDCDVATVRLPLKITKTLGTYDVFVNVNGGGSTGQAGATKLGLARALYKIDKIYIASLREAKLMTRDSRMKERKKYGQKGARKSFQWTKR